MSIESVNVAILGASGYVGAELIRLLAIHPRANIRALSADRKAGQPICEVYPHFRVFNLPVLQKISQVNFEQIDIIFCALPHATSQEVVRSLPSDKIVIDLSADFRIWNTNLYEEIYDTPHKAPELQPSATYGLTEVYGAAIATSNLIACPGCYPTSALLPLVPLIKARSIKVKNIVIDSKTGVSGAGRGLKEGILFAEVAEGIHAYGIGTHRHAPEIEQILTDANGGDQISVTFTPHLVPMNRGILSTIYVNSAPHHDVKRIHTVLEKTYANHKFVHVLPSGEVPATRHVRGTNHVMIGTFAGRVSGQLIVVCAIDNLTKGSSGQAVQNMNIRMGWPEEEGLQTAALFP